MLITHMLKILRFIVILFFLSYFTGLIWFVFSEMQFLGGAEENYISAFNKDQFSNYDNTISLTYFAFTTLTTVGLGDYHPFSNNERILCSFIMLFGVTCTSYLMDNFSRMLQALRNIDKNHEESERFHLFLGTLRKFNDYVRISDTFETKLEAYFQYRWQFNRNLAVSTPEDEQIFEELPGRLQTQLYVEYLFKNFMDIYSKILDINQTRYEFKRKVVQVLNQSDILRNHINQLDWTKYY